MPLSIGALALAGAALAVVGVAPIVASTLQPFEDFAPPEPLDSTEFALMSLGVAASTVTLLTVALWLSMRAKRNVAFKTVFWCLFFGWLNTGGSLALGSLFCGDYGQIASGLGLGLILGVVFGTPFGFVYGCVAAVATHNLRALLDRPTLTSRLDAQRLVSLLVIGASSFALLAHHLGWGELVPVELPAGVLCLGAFGLAQALLRRLRLTRLAKSPDRHGYERVALDDLGVDASGLWPLHPGVPVDATHALVKREVVSGEGAYRRASPRVPLALVA